MELLHLFSQKICSGRWVVPAPETVVWDPGIPDFNPEAKIQNPAKNVIQGPSAGASKLGNPKTKNPKQPFLEMVLR